MSERNQIHVGDCRDLLASWPSDSIDSIVTDPPYGLAFMGQGWDRGVPGCEFWEHALRVAKPGAHLLAFGGTRTYHRLACAIEDAGWQIRDCLGWIYGSGFPKSLDVSKAIDKAAGAEREVVGMKLSRQPTGNAYAQDEWTKRHGVPQQVNITAPATDAARQWAGWGTALKPAMEMITVARKPLCGTVAENVLEWGTGAINVDGCRVGTNPGYKYRADANETTFHGKQGERIKQSAEKKGSEFIESTQGRWPANIIHDGSDEVLGLFPHTTSGSIRLSHVRTTSKTKNAFSERAAIPEESYGDSGSASRFFYCAKASRSERGEGNHHPTVKPLTLMRYLCRLVTPPNGLVLDMFSGSGSTLVAACLEKFAFAGCELSPEYAEIAKRRVVAAQEIVARSQGKSVQQVLEL